MSKILRRPMFRGGPTNRMTGIMSGIEDRQNYENAGPVFKARTPEEIRATYKSPVQEEKDFDPLTTFLLQYGPALASAKPTGSLIGTAVGAAAGPIQSMLAEQAERKKYRRDVEAGLSQMAMEQAGREQLLERELASKEAIAKKQLEAMGGERLQSLTDKYFSIYNDFILAENRAKHDVNNIPGLVRNKFGKDQYGGLLEGGDIDKQAQKLGKKDNEGKVYYDLTDGRTKRLRKDVTGKYDWEIVSTQGEPEEGVGQPAPGDTATAGAKEIVTTDKTKFEDIFKPGATATDKAIIETIKSTSEKLKEGQKKITGPFR